jgi:hypothetical protein
VLSKFKFNCDEVDKSILLITLHARNKLPLPRGKRRKLDRLVVKAWNVETLTRNRLVDWLAEQDGARRLRRSGPDRMPRQWTCAR